VPLEHWVSRIAVNTCLSQLKAERSRPELRWADLSEEQCAVLENLASNTSELHPAQALAAREIVAKLLSSLTPAERLLVTQLYLEGRSIKEIRQTTGWSGALIRLRAFRTRRKLKKSFTRLMREEK